MLEDGEDVQVGGSECHQVDLGGLVVEGVGISDESVGSFEGGEGSLSVYGVGDAVKVKVSSVRGLVDLGDVEVSSQPRVLGRVE